MTSEFRSRRFIPVASQERPRRSRRASRVLITDGESILLFTDTDPGIPGSRWWVTPGGGIDPGETAAQAAVREVAMAKLFATESAQRIIDRAVQLHGGLGVQRGAVVERLYREVRPLRIYEGTSEIQKLVIAGQLLEAARHDEESGHG